jgi:hypothetical protein
MAKYFVEVAKFDGGLNTKNSPMNLPSNQSPLLNNVTFDDYGAVGTRKGKTALTSLGSGIIDGMEKFSTDSGQHYLVVACSGAMWQAASGASFSSIPSAASIFTAGVDVTMFQTKKYLVQTNGYVRPYKFDGTYYTNFGPSAPVGVATAACAGAGNLTGTYQYVFTGINSWQVESNYGSATTTYTWTSGQATLSSIPSFPVSAGVNQIGIYRTSGAVSGLYYRVATVSNGVSGYTDNVADSLLGTSSLHPEAPLDNGVMPPCKYLTEHLGYVFAAGDPSNPNRLYFSQGGQPETFPSENFIDIGPGDGYPITGISAYTNSIIIQKNDGFGDGEVYMLYMPDSTGASDSSNWYVVKSPSAYGGQSGKALAFFGNLLAFVNKNGMFALEGANIALSASDTNSGKFTVDSHSFDIEPDILGFKQSLMPSAAMINYKNKLWLSVPSGSSSTTNDKIYQYDYVRASNSDRTRGAWSVFDTHSLNNFAEYQGQLYGGSAKDGTIYTLDYGYNDNGSAIDSYYVTAPVSGLPEHKDFVKVWRWVILTISCYGKYFMTVSYILDFEDLVGTPIQVSLDGGGMYWGTGIWGKSKWGAGAALVKRKVYLNAVSKDIQLRFETNQKDVYWKVHKAQFVYNLRSMR